MAKGDVPGARRGHEAGPQSGQWPQAGEGVFATTRRTIERARQQRRSGNLSEVLLWRALRSRPHGIKFRRQHPIGRWNLDFACLSARLAIEIDGEAHTRADRPIRDAHRDADLAARGFRTMRLPADLILTDLDAAVRAIVAGCQPLHQPAAGPPPRTGEVSAEHP